MQVIEIERRVIDWDPADARDRALIDSCRQRIDGEVCLLPCQIPEGVFGSLPAGWDANDGIKKRLHALPQKSGSFLF